MSVWHHLNRRQLLKENEFFCCGQIPPFVWRSARLVLSTRGSWSDYSSENCWTVPSPEDEWCVTCEEGSTWISSSHILAAFEVFSNFPVCHKSQNQSYFQTWLKHSRNSQPAMSQFLSISRLLLRRPVHRFGLQPRFCSSVGGEQQLKRETLFFDPEMQQLLLRLQGRDHTKVFSEKCQHTSKLNVPCRCLGQGSLRLIQTDLFISSWRSRSCSFWSKTLIPVHSPISDGLWYKMESSCLTGRSWKRLNRRWRRRCQRNCRCRRSWRRGTRPARSCHGHGCG